jgi:hypothetical protein
MWIVGIRSIMITRSHYAAGGEEDEEDEDQNDGIGIVQVCQQIAVRGL